jgi:DNA-directed RNA polymerase subunit alpha
MLKIKLNKNFKYYSSFTIGPLEKNVGITIGNMLRRTLLGNLKGLGIIGISYFVDNKNISEFTSLSSIRESVLEISENLVSLIFIDKQEKNLLKFPEIFLKIKGPKRIIANDLILPNEIEIIQPNHYLGTINHCNEIEIHITLGYDKFLFLSFEENLIDFNNLNNFNPVERVNYKVEKIINNSDFYEQLILEIWTNGSISPQKALAKASNIIYDQVKNLLIQI